MGMPMPFGRASEVEVIARGQRRKRSTSEQRLDCVRKIMEQAWRYP